MPDTSRSRSANGYRWLFKGRNTSFRSAPVYQISRYPSSDMRIEKAFGSQSGGTNTLNALGKEILHLGLYGEILVFTSLATIAARLESSAEVASANATDLP